MPEEVKKASKLEELTSDQIRRIYRDYLKGVPVEKIQTKQRIEEDLFWKIVGIYRKRKHPNDVGFAKDISGPTDLIVSTLDTGSQATEGPVIAYSPKDLRVPRELLQSHPEPYDYNSPEERLRALKGELDDQIAKKNAEQFEANKTEAQKQAEASGQTSKEIMDELDQVGAQKAEEMQKEAAEEAKKAGDPGELLRAAREAREKRVIADQAGEAAIEKARADYAEEHAEDWDKAVEAGKKQNEEELKKQTEAREKEAEQRKQDHDKLRKEAEDAERKLAELSGAADKERERAEAARVEEARAREASSSGSGTGPDSSGSEQREGDGDGSGRNRQPSTEKGAGAEPGNPATSAAGGAPSPAQVKSEGGRGGRKG